MNLWDELEKMRDKQRKQLATSRAVVRYDEVPWELNKYGKVKWYTHPSIKDTATRSLMVHVLEIPPGSRSGKIQHQGGTAYYVWAGKGYSTINGEKYEWETDDVLLLPILPEEGVVYQHFNTDLENPARLVGATPNIFDAVGVDLGIGLEVLENCPEFEATQKAKKKVAAKKK